MSYYFDIPGLPGGPEGLRGWDDELDECSSWADDPRGRIPLSLAPAQQSALVVAIEAGLRERGCDCTLRSAQEWAAGQGVEWAGLRAALEGRGGYCDCEVLLNVLPADDTLEPD